MLVHTQPTPPPTCATHSPRSELRRQIARLERELAHFVGGLPPNNPARGLMPSSSGRLLSLSELEIERDRLVGNLIAARTRLQRQARAQSAARATLEAMTADSRRFKFVRISNAALGLPGCGVYHCRPRLGLVGMLAGWWEVKLSSGCP